MKQKYFYFLIIFSSLIFFNCSDNNDKSISAVSPDQNIKISFLLINDKPTYNIIFKEDTLISNSSLGFKFKNMEPLTGEFEIVKVTNTNFDEVWKPVWGTDNEIRNNYSQLKVELKERENLERKLTLYFRAYNDGIAFRYEIPEQKNIKYFEIISEETYFNLVGNYKCWWIPNGYDSYEYLYNTTPLSEVEGVNTPITMKTDKGIYLSLHEANLTDYPGMTLIKNTEKQFSLKADLVPWPDSVKVKATAPHFSPWRTIQIADEAGKLIESHLILNLNEPSKLENTDWIKPMKYVGIWWGMHIDKYTWHSGPKHGATTENTKQYIDFAAKHNLGGVLVEGWNEGWDTWLSGRNEQNYLRAYPDFDLLELSKYAKEKGVMLIGHHETGGNIASYEEQIDSAFSLYSSLGIHAVKTGYAGTMVPPEQHHHGQWMVNHYRMVVTKAADYNIMIDAHEPIKPTGIERTYPNMMTREGARGMEYNAWSEGNPPEHTTILPFTRFLAGPMDYTPGIFDLTFNQYKPNNRVYTTLAKQLAYYVILYSPLQMAADLIENYQEQPAFKFIENVPVNWDKTDALNCEIGDYVTIARKNGENWYIGSITDENFRLLNIELSFLDVDKTYKAVIFSDSKNTDWENNPAEIEIDSFYVNNNDILRAALSNSSGIAVELIPVENTEDLKSISIFNNTADKKIEEFKKLRVFQK